MKYHCGRSMYHIFVLVYVCREIVDLDDWDLVLVPVNALVRACWNCLLFWTNAARNSSYWMEPGRSDSVFRVYSKFFVIEAHWCDRKVAKSNRRSNCDSCIVTDDLTRSVKTVYLIHFEDSPFPGIFIVGAGKKVNMQVFLRNSCAGNDWVYDALKIQENRALGTHESCSCLDKCARIGKQTWFDWFSG